MSRATRVAEYVEVISELVAIREAIADEGPTDERARRLAAARNRHDGLLAIMTGGDLGKARRILTERSRARAEARNQERSHA